MKSLLVLSAPQHILYGVEARAAYAAGQVDALIINREPKCLNLLIQMLEDFSFPCCDVVNMSTKLRKKFPSVIELIYSISRSVHTLRYDTVFLADYGGTIVANMRSVPFICYLGDGTKQICRSMGDPRFVAREDKLGKLDHLVKMFGVSVAPVSPDEVFSPFSAEDGKENKLSALSALYDSLDFEESEAVYFFGTYFSDNEQVLIMDDVAYFNLIMRIKTLYQIENKKFVYVPHRMERSQKLSKLGLMGIDIDRFQYPAEYEFVKRGYKPRGVAGFYSSCLYHFKLLHKNINVRAFRPNDCFFHPSYFDSVRIVYDWYGSRLDVVDI